MAISRSKHLKLKKNHDLGQILKSGLRALKGIMANMIHSEHHKGLKRSSKNTKAGGKVKKGLRIKPVKEFKGQKKVI